MTPTLLSLLSVRIETGFPWTRAQLSAPITERITAIALVESASFQRWQPAAGVSLRWVDRAWAIDGDMLLGGTIQGGVNSLNGTALECRIQTERQVGTVRPWLYTGVRPTALLNQNNIDTESGVITEYSWDNELSYSGSFGVDVVVKDWSFGIGLDLPWITVPTPSIPGVHLSLGYGGAAR